MLFRILNTAFCFFLLQNIYSQTCCTAGAPISSNLEISNSEINSFSFQLGYSYKSINLLIDNDERLVNDPRTRYGQNLGLKVDYVLSKKWAVSAILPLVHQARSTISQSQSSFGLGDLSLIGQYLVYGDQRSALNVSGGVKLPIGKVDHRDASNIFLSPDMQSGSGSYDFIFRTSYNRTRFLTPLMTINVSAVFRRNGFNHSFGSTDNFEGRSFAFGNNAIFVLGLRYLINYKLGFLIPDVALKYRWGGANQEEESTASNSGGNWISVPIGFSYDLDGKKSVRLYGELPVYQKLDGLQITTDFEVGVQLSYLLLQKNNTDNLIEF